MHSFARPGGVKEHVLALHNEFLKRGIDSKIVIPRRSPSEKYGEDKILFGTSIPLSFNGTDSDFTICFTPGSIQELLNKENFDIIHFHSFGFHSWQILEESKAVNVLTFHACTSLKVLRSNPWTTKVFPLLHFWRTGRFKTLEGAIRENAHKMQGVIGVARLNVDMVKKLGYKGLTQVIPNGINLKQFNPFVPKIKKYCDGKINLLFVSRIEERKGLIYLLQAYNVLQKKYKNLRLLVVGDGPLRPECEEYVKNQKLKDVVFEGRVPIKALPSYYTTADIFCAPATHGESFGIILLEAMASKTSVVAFANPGYRGVLTGKGKQFLVEPKDWKGLAGKIEILVKSKEKREEMEKWGFEEAQDYAWEKIADRVLDFYELARKEKSKGK